MGLAHQPFELTVSASLTLPARAMTSCQGCDLIEEEQLRVRVRLHESPFAIPEVGKAVNPIPVAPTPRQLLAVIVKNAPVPHELPAVGHGNDLPKRCNPVP